MYKYFTFYFLLGTVVQQVYLPSHSSRVPISSGVSSGFSGFLPPKNLKTCFIVYTENSLSLSIYDMHDAWYFPDMTDKQITQPQ